LRVTPVGDSNESSCHAPSVWLTDRVNDLGTIIFVVVVVPTQIPVLGRVVTHFRGVVRVEWVAHHARVISVGCTVKSTGVGHAEIVSKLVNQHAGVGEITVLIYAHPAIDIGVGRVAAIVTWRSVALLHHEQHLFERPRKTKSKSLLDLQLGVVVYLIAGHVPGQRHVNGDSHSTGVGSTPSVGQLIHTALAVHLRCIIVAWDDVQLVVGTGFQLRLQCCGVSTCAK